MSDIAKSVLAIDDSEEILLLVRVVLERQGYYVECVSTPSEAIHKFLARRYAVILLDWKMPHNGGRFIDYLESDQQESLSKVIILTALSPNSVPERIREKLCAVVQKPFELEHLVRLVAACAAKSDTSSYVR